MAPAATAQSLPRWTVTPSAGTIFGDELDQPSTTVGLAAGLAAAPRFMLESEIGRVVELVGLSVPRGSAWLFSGRFLFLAAPADLRVVPYGSVGGSFVRLAARLWFRADLRFIHVNDAPNFWRGSLGLTVGFD